jgi:hypothetical protein
MNYVVIERRRRRRRRRVDQRERERTQKTIFKERETIKIACPADSGKRDSRVDIQSYVIEIT